MSLPTVVLLHGVGLDHTVWDQARVLLGGDYTVIAPDLPGHGSNAPVPCGTTLADLAEAVSAVVLPGSHLVGFSLGALVAQHLAIHRPELVATLTSVSSVCRRTPAERAAVLDRLAVAKDDLAASSAASLRRWFGGTDVDPAVVEQTRRVLAGNDRGSFLACYQVFATGDAQVGPLLGQISAPSLAITGDLDPGSTSAMTHRLAAAIPVCRAQILPETRHMLPVQRPSQLVTAMTTLIGENTHV